MAHVDAQPVPPVDFNDIGINIKLTDISSGMLATFKLLDPSLYTTVVTNNLQSAIVDGDCIFTAGSTITIDGDVYTVTAHAGNGTYGSVCYVENTAGEKYVLKEQLTEDSNFDFQLVRKIEGGYSFQDFCCLGMHVAHDTITSKTADEIRALPTIAFVDRISAIDAILTKIPSDTLYGGYLTRVIEKFKSNIKEALLQKMSVVQEAMIHHILYTDGDVPVPKLYKIFESSRIRGPAPLPTRPPLPERVMYMLMDRLHIDGHKKIRETAHDKKGDVIKQMYKAFVPILLELFNRYNYNHGDFKPNNCMFDSSGKLYFIDFGFSRLTVNLYTAAAMTFTTSSFNTISTKSKDNTFMAALVLNSLGSVKPPPFISRILLGYGNECNLAKWHKPQDLECKLDVDGTIHTISRLREMYELFNNYENPAGTFEVLTEEAIDSNEEPPLPPSLPASHASTSDDSFSPPPSSSGSPSGSSSGSSSSGSSSDPSNVNVAGAEASAPALPQLLGKRKSETSLPTAPSAKRGGAKVTRKNKARGKYRKNVSRKHSKELQ